MEESIENVKFVVHVAENGHSFELACPATTSIELVQTWLAPLTCIHRQDQLLICDDTRLEPQKSLASYKLPDEERHVFLFNRVSLMADASPPPPEDVDVKEPVLPSPPSTSLSGHPLEEASDPALKALPLYERQFRYHHQKGHAIYDASHNKFEVCRRLHREQQVQNLALDTAKKNMDHYFKIIDQMYSEFMKHYNKQHKQHADILINFERDLERLRACRLHPSLFSEDRSTLFDCVDAANLRKRAEVCANSHKQFQGKVLQLKSIYLELQQNVKELFCTVPSVDFNGLDRMITECARIIEEESSIMQSLSKDVETVRKLVDDGVNRHFSVSLRPHDAVSALGPMYDVHDKNHLPRIEACYQKLGRVLDYFRAKKHEMSVCVHTSMQRVASLQSTIRDMRNQLSAFKEAIARQDELFSELKVVRRIGPAYRACLAEIVRRKSDMKIYMGQAGQLAERMARIREAEVARREEFLRVQSRFICRDVLHSMGLFGVPSQCLVDIEPYDTNLLDIDMKDLERYAPESILGSHLKGAIGGGVSSQGESSLPTSEGSSIYLGSTNNSITNAGLNSKGVIDDVTSEEIAGTSKLEVENAWLKAELASVIALLCNLDPDFDAVVSGQEDECKVKDGPVQKTIQALALKDEHAKHLQDMLKASQLQCSSYEKRVRELEQRLSDQYIELHKLSLEATSVDTKCESSEGGVLNTPATVEPMDDGISSSSAVGVMQPSLPDDNNKHNQDGQFQEGGDETMSELSALSPTCEVLVIDASRQEQSSDVAQDGKVLSLKVHVASLEEAMLKKENDYAAVEERLRVALKDADTLRQELQENAGLLNECQINCAELENCLHLAREEARTKQCTADRKAAEYNSLRAASVKLRGLVERLRHAISLSPSGSTSFAEFLQSFAASLASSETGDDGTIEFRACIRALSERVGWLVQQRTELLERCSLVEASKALLTTELETKTDLLKSQYAKRKVDKQAQKDKICFTRFHVHELAMFSPNAYGHYEAINRGCPNYYLSDESLALFPDNLPTRQQFIIGQIVHIDRNVARPSFEGGSLLSGSGRELSGSATATSASRCQSNPYDLPFGTEYFVVTLAMVPDRLPFAIA